MGVKFARVDSGKHKFIEKRIAGLETLPQLYAVVKSKHYKYIDLLETDHFVNFVKAMQHPV
jgi:hypothetical protein